jgi:hypothetical protein
LLSSPEAAVRKQPSGKLLALLRADQDPGDVERTGRSSFRVRTPAGATIAPAPRSAACRSRAEDEHDLLERRLCKRTFTTPER